MRTKQLFLHSPHQQCPGKQEGRILQRQVGNLTLCKRFHMDPKTETWVTPLAYKAMWSLTSEF